MLKVLGSASLACLLIACGGQVGATATALRAGPEVQQYGITHYEVGEHDVRLLHEGDPVGSLSLSRPTADTVLIRYELPGHGWAENELTRPDADGVFVVPTGEGNAAAAIQADDALRAFFAAERIVFVRASIAETTSELGPSETAWCLGCNAPCTSLGLVSEGGIWEPDIGLYTWCTWACSCPGTNNAPGNCLSQGRPDWVERLRACWEPGSCYQMSYKIGCV